jgi:hypothetical protein
MRSFAFIAICLAASSCRKSEPLPPPVAPPEGGAKVVEDKLGTPGSQDLAPLAGLPQRLDGEAKGRPQSKVPVEHVFSALDQKGIKLVSQHQVLASAAAASYCWLGVTKDTIAIAVCEYDTHDAAVAGEKMMNSRYGKLVPDAVREVNGNTLVTVANASQHRDVRDQVLETFKAL